MSSYSDEQWQFYQAPEYNNSSPYIDPALLLLPLAQAQVGVGVGVSASANAPTASCEPAAEEYLDSWGGAFSQSGVVVGPGAAYAYDDFRNVSVAPAMSSPSSRSAVSSASPSLSHVEATLPPPALSCSYCQAVFGSTPAVEAHIREAHRYRCGQHSKAFTTKRGLLRHQTSNQHAEQAGASSGSSSGYRCACGVVNRSRRDTFLRHLSTCRYASGSFRCECGAAFEARPSLDAHLRACMRPKGRPVGSRTDRAG